MRKNNGLKWAMPSLLALLLVVVIAMGVEVTKGDEHFSSSGEISYINLFEDISYVDLSEAFSNDISLPDLSKDGELSAETSENASELSEDIENSAAEESFEILQSSEGFESSTENGGSQDVEISEYDENSKEAEKSEYNESSEETYSSSVSEEFPDDVILLDDGEKPFVYFQQDAPKWNNLPYGTDKIGSHGCGPVNLAMVISTLTNKVIYPDEAANWSYKNGYWSKGVGTAHALMTAMPRAYGVSVSTINEGNWTAVNKALKEGKYIITRVKSGIFATNNHFLTIRGITADGKYLIANSISEEDSKKEWTLSTLKSQVNLGFWVYG